MVILHSRFETEQSPIESITLSFLVGSECGNTNKLKKQKTQKEQFRDRLAPKIHAIVKDVASNGYLFRRNVSWMSKVIVSPEHLLDYGLSC